MCVCVCVCVYIYIYVIYIFVGPACPFVWLDGLLLLLRGHCRLHRHLPARRRARPFHCRLRLQGAKECMYIYIYVYISISVCIYINIHICIHIYVYIYICMCI